MGAASTSTQRDPAQARIPAERVANEIRELGECFDARIPGADEDEREVTCRLSVVALGRSGLELAEDAIPEPDRVGEIMKPTPCSASPGTGKLRATEPSASTSCS